MDTMLIIDLLVALLAVAVHAAPTRDVHDKGSTEPEHIRYETFKAMTLDERLHHYEGRKIYRPDKTLNCLKVCIEKTPGYDIQNANYGQMCKNRESMLAFDRWFYGGDVGQCIEEQRMAEQTAEVEAGLRDVEMDETPCSIAFAHYDERVWEMCDYIWQNVTIPDVEPSDNWDV
ncbi:hypothetical protein D6C86_00701 [Aureobasidium pullulans]|nr:hypothetical protein D6C86_00701 [Aureobasidium pullulans]